MQKEMALSLSSDTLNEFKTDFDSILRQTISKMLENSEVEGSVSAKITILLEDVVDDDGEAYTRPILKHDVKKRGAGKILRAGRASGRLRAGMEPEARPVCTDAQRPAAALDVRRLTREGGARHVPES